MTRDFSERQKVFRRPSVCSMAILHEIIQFSQNSFSVSFQESWKNKNLEKLCLLTESGVAASQATDAPRLKQDSAVSLHMHCQSSEVNLSKKYFLGCFEKM
jgi:hypothetical protein